MDIDLELQKYYVSRETINNFSAFINILEEWNSKINLVSKNSLAEVWSRHVLDSLQLINYIPSTAVNIVDIGSGGGFPAIILAIALKEKNPAAKITMVESITKKTLYLNDVCTRLQLDNVQVINDRVENLHLHNVDIITARAVAALDVLCGYAHKIGGKNTELLLLKGKSFAEEQREAMQNWNFECQTFANHYSEDGDVVKINNLRKRK